MLAQMASITLRNSRIMRTAGAAPIAGTLPAHPYAGSTGVWSTSNWRSRSSAAFLSVISS